MSTMTMEYRVVWMREGFRKKKVKRYSRRSSADRLIGLLSSPEPWKFTGKDPDEYECCDGIDCGCTGRTVREAAINQRQSLPKLLSVSLETREVGEWRPA